MQVENQMVFFASENIIPNKILETSLLKIDSFNWSPVLGELLALQCGKLQSDRKNVRHNFLENE